MGRAEVEYDEDRISEGEIIAAVSAAGYRATAQSVA
jgi:copper chaperone CopZ